MRACILLVLLVSFGWILGASAQQLVINEIYYDSASTDVHTFTEILGPPGMAMDGYALVNVRGTDGTDYRSVPLTGMVIPADGRLVIAQDNGVPNYDYINTGVDWLNTPAELELRQGTTVIDGICYGYSQFLNCEGGTNGPDVAAGSSISRCPDGRDTNNNFADTAETTTTPGTANTSCPSLPVDMALCEALRLDGSGNPVHQGALVHITSPLTVLSDDDNFSLTNLDVYATDGDCCVNVFAYGQDPVLAVGDWIDVTGTVTIYFGKFEISTPGCVVNFLSGGHPLPVPQEITTQELATNEKDYEGCLVSICGLHSTGTGDPWPLMDSNANYVVEDATLVPITLRVDKETDLDGSPVPVEPFTAIGLVGYYNSGTTPYAQLMPRARADVHDGADCPHAAVCCVGEVCYLVFQADCDAMGGVYHADWLSCGPPNPCALPHVCCGGEICYLVIEEECAAMGGTFHPEWDSCTPNPCRLPHVCCVGETCFITLDDECAAMGGTFHPEWDSCTPNPCELPHVCCVGEDCYVILAGDCAAMGGTFHPEWDSCGPPNPCQVVPAAPDTWGGVKNLYR
jgi:hypothetical protein